MNSRYVGRERRNAIRRVKELRETIFALLKDEGEGKPDIDTHHAAARIAEDLILQGWIK